MSEDNDGQGSGDSTEDSGELIGDEQLPEDLTPSEDNPLAKGPEDEDEKDDDDGGIDPSEQGMT